MDPPSEVGTGEGIWTLFKVTFTAKADKSGRRHRLRPDVGELGRAFWTHCVIKSGARVPNTRLRGQVSVKLGQP